MNGVSGFDRLVANVHRLTNNYSSLLLGWIKSKPLPSRGKHLDEFTQKDNAFLLWNKIANGPFVLVAFMYINWDPNYLWKPEDMTLVRTFRRIYLFALPWIYN